MGMCKPSGGISAQYGPYGRNIKEIEDMTPNSRVDFYDELTGKLLQQRWYGPDGKAEWDRDWDHGNSNGKHEFPHDHYWDFTKPPGKQRLEWNNGHGINPDYC